MIRAQALPTRCCTSLAPSAGLKCGKGCMLKMKRMLLSGAPLPGLGGDYPVHRWTELCVWVALQEKEAEIREFTQV